MEEQPQPTPSPLRPDVRLPQPEDFPRAEFKPEFSKDEPETLLDPQTSDKLGAAIDQSFGPPVVPPPQPPAQLPPMESAQEKYLDPQTSARLGNAISAVTGAPPPPVSGLDDSISPVTGRPKPKEISLLELESRNPGLSQAIEVKGWDDMMDLLRNINTQVNNMAISSTGGGDGR